MRQPKSPRYTHPRTTRVPLTRGTVTKLILLGNVAAIALVIWTAVHIARNPSPPPISHSIVHCDGSDAANRWCIK